MRALWMFIYFSSPRNVAAVPSGSTAHAMVVLRRSSAISCAPGKPSQSTHTSDTINKTHHVNADGALGCSTEVVFFHSAAGPANSTIVPHSLGLGISEASTLAVTTNKYYRTIESRIKKLSKIHITTISAL